MINRMMMRALVVISIAAAGSTYAQTHGGHGGFDVPRHEDTRIPRIVQTRRVPGPRETCNAGIINEQTGRPEGYRECYQSCTLTVYDDRTSEKDCPSCC